MTVVTGRDAMIAGMAPVLREGCFVFCTAPNLERFGADAISLFREDEGWSAILPLDRAIVLGFDCATPMRQITLQVFSALGGVGLTAAVAGALAGAAIACNMVSAFHHDHAFVPAAHADRALAMLQRLQADIAVASSAD
ncbi:ACT domain-containing protein [Sphingomonas sp. GC_Shp_3]|uniref:ACT domain-containing protein n=1 Tax=Sphingomonas sp. GC_Shp_3 TaxID=2937383 RepID=UPI00226AB3D1